MTAEATSGAKETFQFGDSPEMADRLAALVIAGVKTGTCSAAVHGPDTHVGARQICLNGAGLPVCEIETLSLQTLPFEEVTPDMAALEGEGDLSYRYWRDVHIAYFKREQTWAPDMSVIFETFKRTQILDHAFAGTAEAHVTAERAEAAHKGYTGPGVKP